MRPMCSKQLDAISQPQLGRSDFEVFYVNLNSSRMSNITRLKTMASGNKKTNEEC